MNKLIKGMMIGSLVGGVVALINKETRQEAKQMVRKTWGYVKEPRQVTECFGQLKDAYDEISEDMKDVFEAVDHAKEQTKETLEKLKAAKQEWEDQKNIE